MSHKQAKRQRRLLRIRLQAMGLLITAAPRAERRRWLHESLSQPRTINRLFETAIDPIKARRLMMGGHDDE